MWSLYDEFRTARYEKKCYAVMLKNAERKDFWLEIALAVFTPASAVAGLFFWSTPTGQTIWQVCLAVAAVLAVAKPLLRLSEKTGELRNCLGKITMLEHDFHVLTIRINEQGRYDNEMRKRFQDLMNEKGTILSSCIPVDLKRSKCVKMQKDVNHELPAANFFEPVEVKP